MERKRQNFQQIAWFWDLFQRDRLNLDPPYQRRSVWNQKYKDYFIDTILLGYPCPAIFLFEEMEADGIAEYHVVDGKQRLTTIFEFLNDEFPVSEEAEKSALHGKYFKDLADEWKRDIWRYEFAVEYLPTCDEGVINNVFDRINRNVAKLSRQELRHARFDGEFITACESLAETLLPNFPSIQKGSQRQMKDVELVAYVLLLLEEGPKSYSQDGLDEAFSDRDIVWDNKATVETEYKSTLGALEKILDVQPYGSEVLKSRFKNQTDFYSLFGAIAYLQRKSTYPKNANDIAIRLAEFAKAVQDEDLRQENPDLKNYYDAARSASNDVGPRQRRIEIIERTILGELQVPVAK